MTPPTEGAPSAPERVWIDRSGLVWSDDDAAKLKYVTEYIRFDAALAAIAGMLEAEADDHDARWRGTRDHNPTYTAGLRSSAGYLRQRREL